MNENIAPTTQSSTFKTFGSLKLPIVRRPASAIAMLFASAFIMLVILSAAVTIIGRFHEMDTRILRISTVMQDLLVFILPALVAAIIATRLPASLLTINVKPRAKTALMALLVLVASIPAMEFIISLNMSVHLPDSMKSVEEALRSMEGNANESVSLMMGGNTIFDLIISIMLIGVMTGLSEELFFRGALQNLFFSTKMKPHVAVWITALIFSFMHFQFFGFVPRVLLGAYLGYLIWWSGSVWVPVLVHTLNNSIAVATTWVQGRSYEAMQAEKAITDLTGSDYVTIALSTAVTIIGIIILRRVALKENKY